MAKNHFKIAVYIVLIACMFTFAASSVLPEISGSSCCSDDSIYVNGQGKVSVQPDVAYINVGISVTAKTSQEASQKVNEKLNQVIQILKSNKIKSDDIKTQSLSIYPQYDYPNGKAQLIGQNAQQTLTVTVRNINQSGGNLGTIIDQLVGVDGIQFNGLNFDKQDKSDAQKQARKLAFENAKSKANEYATLAQRALGKVLTINDDGSNSSGPIVANQNAFLAKSVSTSVPVGKLDVTYSISVKFALR